MLSSQFAYLEALFGDSVAPSVSLSTSIRNSELHNVQTRSSAHSVHTDSNKPTTLYTMAEYWDVAKPQEDQYFNSIFRNFSKVRTAKAVWIISNCRS
jgi:hypothetical protein